jgi:hypothetical protein
MYAYAKELFSLDVTVGGATRRSHMLAAGYSNDELVKAEKPLLLSDVFDWFMDLRSARKSNGFALMSIEFSEIHAYFSMRKIQIEKWELDLIRALDSISLEALRENK